MVTSDRRARFGSRGRKAYQRAAAVGAGVIGGGGGAPVVLKPLVWSNLLRAPDSVSAALSTDKHYRHRGLHLTGFEASRFRVGFYPWSKPSSEADVTAPYTVLRCALEISGGYVPVTFGGSESIVVDPSGDDIILSDWLYPDDLVGGVPITSFPADAETYIRYKCMFQAGGTLPKGALGKGQGQTQGLYDVSEEASSGEVYGTGAYAATPASYAAPDGNIGLPALLIGDPVAASAKGTIVVGTSITHGWADSAWGSSGLTNKAGYGYADRATVDASNQNVLALVHSTQPGERLNQWLARADRTLALFDYANVLIDDHGTNDIGTGTGGAAISLAQMQADKLTFWAMARARGVQYIITLPLLPRTNSGNTAPLSTPWADGGQRDQFNAWQLTQVGVGDGPDVIVDYLSVVQNPSDHSLWLADYGDGVHPNSTAHGLLTPYVRTAWLAAEVNGGATGPTGPSILSAPTVSGLAQVGEVLTRTGQGTYTASPTGRTGQWRRDGDAISGATGTTYTLVSGDLGAVVDYLETATFSSGGPVANDSLNIGPILAAGAPINTVLPVVTGTAQTGQTLSVNTGTWTNSPTGYTYQWLREGAPVSGETGTTYALTGADIDKYISVQVTATNGSGSMTVETLTVGPVTLGGGATILFEDTFTNAGSSVNIESWTSDSGHNYTRSPVIGTPGTGTMSVNGAGNGRVTSNHTNSILAYVDDLSLSSADYDVEFVIDKKATSGSGNRVSVAFRHKTPGADTTPTTYWLRFNDNGDTWSIERLKGGTTTTLASVTNSLPDNTIREGKISVRNVAGSVQITVYLYDVGLTDDVLIPTYTDSADPILDAGSVGVNLATATTSATTGACLSELRVVSA